MAFEFEPLQPFGIMKLIPVYSSRSDTIGLRHWTGSPIVFVLRLDFFCVRLERWG